VFAVGAVSTSLETCLQRYNRIRVLQNVDCFAVPQERKIGEGGSTVLSGKLDFLSPEVQALRLSMSAAHEECEESYLRYEHAFSIAAHTNPLNSVDMTALLRSGRDYAKSIVRHSNAVMSWLAFVDRSR
jgi:hypothetical protein